MNEGPANIISGILEFAKKHRLVTPLEKGSTEETLCEYLLEKITEFFGPIRAQGKDWLLYEDGIWRLIEPDVFGSIVLDVIHPDNRTSRRADSLEAYLARRLRAETPVDYSSCYKFAAAGTVLINCANGVLSVSREKVELLPHASEHNFRTKIVTAYNAGATCPVFEAAVEAAMPDGLDIDLFRLMCGYLFYPSCRYNSCLILYGESTTGKSKIAEAVANVLGTDLTCCLSLHEMCKRVVMLYRS